MIRVVCYDDEPLKSVLRRFKKACEKEGLIRDIKRHEFYEKPSEQHRRARMRSIKAAQKAQFERQSQKQFDSDGLLK